MSTITVLRRAAIVAIFGALLVPATAAADFGLTEKFTDINYRSPDLIDAIRKSEATARPAGDDWDAANAVERRLDRIYPRWDWMAFCDQVSRRRYSCEISGFGRGLSMADGRATATPVGYYSRYRIRIHWLQFD